MILPTVRSDDCVRWVVRQQLLGSIDAKYVVDQDPPERQLDQGAEATWSITSNQEESLNIFVGRK